MQSNRIQTPAGYQNEGVRSMPGTNQICFRPQNIATEHLQTANEHRMNINVIFSV